MTLPDRGSLSDNGLVRIMYQPRLKHTRQTLPVPLAWLRVSLREILQCLIFMLKKILGLLSMSGSGWWMNLGKPVWSCAFWRNLWALEPLLFSPLTFNPNSNQEESNCNTLRTSDDSNVIISSPGFSWAPHKHSIPIAHAQWYQPYRLLAP